MNPKILILRHKRENLQKCSLRGLETHPDITFYTYPKESLPPLHNTILLTLGAPILTKEDEQHNILLLDGTWRYAKTMYEQLPKPHLFVKRSLSSSWKTAYPRRQDDCPDPSKGLASLEALFAVFITLGKDPTGLLDL